MPGRRRRFYNMKYEYSQEGKGMSGTLQTDKQTGAQTENMRIGRVRRDKRSDRHSAGQ
jgi:hypothetical protein